MKQKLKEKLKQKKLQLFELEKKLPYILMMKYFELQKEILTLEKSLEQERQAEEKLKEIKR